MTIAEQIAVGNWRATREFDLSWIAQCVNLIAHSDRIEVDSSGEKV